MNNFCKVHCVSAKEKEVTTYVIFEPEQDLVLTEAILKENNQYREFINDYKPKVIYVDYSVYTTEESINASLQPETFEEIIFTSATLVSTAELTIETNKKVKKKKKSNTRIIAICCFIAVLTGFFGMLAGTKISRDKETLTEETIADESIIQNISEDGMIIPVAPESNASDEQITVSIDRSYSSIPKEDLELKGSIVDGKAVITLPSFDRTDFFTHVAGYTWGFSSNPDSEKIEYYGGMSYNFTEDTKLYRVLVKYGGGSGTKDDPYIINYFDQLELMASEKVRGYFKQTANISFPTYASHSPINTVNELKNSPNAEYFEYDGNGYIIENIDNPLFGNVSGATIKNVNIRNSVINVSALRDYGAIVCNAYNYQYKANNTSYETGETLIKHCTVSHTSINLGTKPEEATYNNSGEVIPPSEIEYDENGNVIEKDISPELVVKSAEYSIGGISGNGGQIEDCYVTDLGINVYSNNYVLNVGGISGKPANVINSAVYFFSTQGNIFNAGGIVGEASGSRYYDAYSRELPIYYGGNIQGCVARKVILTSELNVGGIAGTGGSNSENSVISNCYVKDLSSMCGVFSTDGNHALIKAGTVGGIIGSDNTSRYGHIISNCVSTADTLIIGNATRSKFDDTNRQAPDYAYYQENIITVINKNTINPNNPKEIFTGVFSFRGDVFGDNGGSLAYPNTIEDLFGKTVVEENQDG